MLELFIICYFLLSFTIHIQYTIVAYKGDKMFVTIEFFNFQRTFIITDNLEHRVTEKVSINTRRGRPR